MEGGGYRVYEGLAGWVEGVLARWHEGSQGLAPHHFSNMSHTPFPHISEINSFFGLTLALSSRLRFVGGSVGGGGSSGGGGSRLRFGGGGSGSHLLCLGAYAAGLGGGGNLAPFGILSLNLTLGYLKDPPPPEPPPRLQPARACSVCVAG